MKYINWTTETVEELPFDTDAFIVAGVGINETSEAQFFVLQIEGTNDNPSLYIYGTNGTALSTEPLIGLSKEMQILQVPETTNEWYLIYGGEPGEIVFSSSAAYTHWLEKIV